MAKHIFVTGGVASSLGKGLTASSLGRLLKARGHRVTITCFGSFISEKLQVIGFQFYPDGFIVHSQIIKPFLCKLFPDLFIGIFLPVFLFVPKVFRNWKYGHNRIRIQLVRFDLSQGIHSHNEQGGSSDATHDQARDDQRVALRGGQCA